VKTASKEQASIGERLRWAREQAGLSQGQVAKLLICHRPTISQLESGERALKANEVLRFAELYDVQSGWILEGDNALGVDEDPRIQLAARELSKLSSEDLETLMRLVKVLRTNKE
jgi:transcriptional regulator with XRE-family HTH domain